jgi:PAS domain S-box-containing protein
MALPLLSQKLQDQEPWSDLPIIVLTHGGAVRRRAIDELRLPEALGNVMFLERPLNAMTLVSAVRTALRARRRQRQVRQYIAERTAAADRLRESEERFRTVADSAPVLIWMTDSEGSLTFANRHYERVFGLPPAAMLGDGWSRILSPAEAAAYEAAFRAAFADRRHFTADIRITDRDRRLRWLRCEGVPRQGAGGAFAGYVGCNSDITEPKLAADALERAVAERTGELAAANRQLVGQIDERERVEATLRQMQRLEAVGQLTAGVAHDFNNLLTVILGNVGFLERQMEDERIAARLSYMRTAAERGAKLTAQLLAFSRRQPLDPKPIDLNDNVAGMRELLQSSMGGSIRIEIVLKPGLWRALVDPTQLELVILNLAINARDAMPVGGTLLVETANTRIRAAPRRPSDPEPGDYVVVSVIDSGAGMPDDVLAKAFEPFFTTKEVGKGSGLGLSQVLGFAKQSGGGVRIETRLGEGTTVRVYLPRAAAALDDDPDETAALPAAPQEAARGNPHILLVDDDSAVREITATLLKELGYRVTEAGSGGAALDMLGSGPSVDLLLVDFAMPGMNGAEVAREARGRFAALPIVFLTGYADQAAIRTVGQEFVVQKPFRNEELAAKLQAAFAAARGGSNLLRFRR